MAPAAAERHPPAHCHLMTIARMKSALNQKPVIARSWALSGLSILMVELDALN